MRFTLLLLSSLVVLSGSSAACSAPSSDTEEVNLFHGNPSDGAGRKLEFAYNGRDCLLGCPVDRPALQGSQVNVFARGEFNTSATARIGNPAIAKVAGKDFSCGGKQCTLSLEIETSQSGDTTLEIVDGSGDLIDLVTLHVRPAARIDVTLGGGTEVAGVYEVKRFSRATLGSRVYDAENVELAFDKHGMSFDYADKSILRPDPTAIFGSTNVEDMIAIDGGETVVKAHAPGAEKVVRFRIVP